MKILQRIHANLLFFFFGKTVQMGLWYINMKQKHKNVGTEQGKKIYNKERNKDIHNVVLVSTKNRLI